MIVYVNGDSHSAGAEAVNTHCFANDDQEYVGLGRKPHPDNLKVSYGQLIANQLGATLVCDAESGSSNTRILRTTNSFLDNSKPDLVIIGWATWEREEVIVDGIVYQFSAGLILDCWPPFPNNVKEQYKEWVLDRHDVQIYSNQTQNDIWQLHRRLESEQIPHIFFNTFSGLTPTVRLDWDNSYYKPYNHTQSYFKLLEEWGYSTITPTSYHYGADAHQAWADFLLSHLTNILKESIITT